jgi:hypothetical protein
VTCVPAGFIFASHSSTNRKACIAAIQASLGLLLAVIYICSSYQLTCPTGEAGKAHLLKKRMQSPQPHRPEGWRTTIPPHGGQMVALTCIIGEATEQAQRMWELLCVLCGRHNFVSCGAWETLLLAD